jgi:hypothetical protein
MSIIRKRHCSVCGQTPAQLGGIRVCDCPGRLYPWWGGERGNAEEEERLSQARYSWIAGPGYYAFEHAAPIISLYEGRMWGCDSATDYDIDVLEEFLRRQEARLNPPKLTGTFSEKIDQVIDMPDSELYG